MDNTPKNGNKLVPVLVVLLIVASFFIGSLYTKVQVLEKGNVAGVQGGTGGDGGGGGGTAPNVEPTPQPVDVDITNGLILGNSNAKVAVVEFTDYQCPFCKRQFESAFPSIKKDYIDTNKVRYVVFDFPLEAIHPQAKKSAEATHCANDQGKFWEFHDKLFVNQTALTNEDLKKYAGELGLNISQFSACFDSGKYTKKVENAQKSGEGYGVRGTPATFVGVIKGSTVVQAEQISGAQPYSIFKEVIDAQLAKS